MTSREDLAARLETMADRMVLMASDYPPITCGAILSDAKVLREAAQLIRESAEARVDPREPGARVDLETLDLARKAIRETLKVLIALSPRLEEPYEDDPRWSPWTRFIDLHEGSPWKLLQHADAALHETAQPDPTPDRVATHELDACWEQPGTCANCAPNRVAEGARIDPMNFSDPWHPDSDDYVATNLLRHIDEMPNSGDWHGMLRAWAEQRSTGKLQPNRPYEPAPTTLKGEDE